MNIPIPTIPINYINFNIPDVLFYLIFYYLLAGGFLGICHVISHKYFSFFFIPKEKRRGNFIYPLIFIIILFFWIGIEPIFIYYSYETEAKKEGKNGDNRLDSDKR